MKSLFFDLDNTLVDSELSYRFAMSQIGVDPDCPTFKMAREEVKLSLPSGSPIARSRILYFKRYLELKCKYSAKRHYEMSIEYERNVVQDMARQWNKLNRNKLFSELRSRVHRIGIVTNESLRMQVQKVSAFDPESKIFDFIVTSEECGCEKPSSKIFATALSKVQVEKSQCFMIGDNYEQDIVGALDFGIKAIQSQEFKATNKTGPLVIGKLDEVLSYF